ncbi:MAG TPA: ABC transporter substrate-binding protein [Stellaceae bacterium]|nr:ABC transporter substrate-binding protein [Stellaceae bacterium]
MPIISRRLAIALTLLAGLLVFVGGLDETRVRAAEAPVVASSKIDTEGALLGQMIAAVIEAQGIPVERRIGLGPTNIVRGAMLAGQIDVYPEYTGNGAFFFHRENDPVWKNAAKGYAEIAALDKAQNHLIWLTPAPADNTWVIAIRKDLPGFPVKKCLDELATYLKGGGQFKLAASAEFVSSAAALPAFEQTYGFHLTADQILTLSGGNTATTLRAAAEGISGVNAAMAYGTDGELAALGLTALCDDKGAQVVYAPTPVIREAVLDAHPKIGPALAAVFSSLTVETLRELNARIAVSGEQPQAVAMSYLKSKHLLP